MGKVSFKTTAGILSEIEESVNDFKTDTGRYNEAELRIRGCNSAIKVHMMDYLIRKEEKDAPQKVQRLRSGDTSKS